MKIGCLYNSAKCINIHYLVTVMVVQDPISGTDFSTYSYISIPAKNNFRGKDTHLLMGWNISNIGIWYMALKAHDSIQ